jgi:hypothetical protein
MHCCCHCCRYVQSELVHSRFAMAAVAGILIPEARLRWHGTACKNTWSHLQ